MTAVYILLIILALIGLVFLVPVHITVLFNAQDKEVNLKYGFFKKTLYPGEEKSATDEKKSEDKPKEKTDFKMYTELIKELFSDVSEMIKSISRYTFKYALRVRTLNISGKFGTGDPMYTGMLCGAVYPIAYNAVSYADRNMRLEKWDVNIEPDFDNAVFKAGIYSDISTTGAHAAILLFIIAPHIIRILRKYSKISGQY